MDYYDERELAAEIVRRLGLSRDVTRNDFHPSAVTLPALLKIVERLDALEKAREGTPGG